MAQAGHWQIRMNNIDHWASCEARVLVESRRLLSHCSVAVNDSDAATPVIIYPRVGPTVIRVNPGEEACFFILMQNFYVNATLIVSALDHMNKSVTSLHAQM